MMNPALRLTSLLALAFALALPAPVAAAEQLYTCGMHPQIIKKEPGTCPICSMKLTPVRANQAAAGSQAQAIQIDGATVQRMNLKLGTVARGPVRREIRTVGTVAFDESGLRDVTLKYEGWIEKQFVATTWAAVKAGEALFEVYSPELYNAQLNYLVALRSEGAASASPGPLARAALARLQLFDLPADFIAEVARSGEARRTHVVRAAAAGVVIDKMAVAGQMMRPGERIYRLADLSSVWVHAQIHEQDLAFVRAGQEVAVRATYGPERKFAGAVQLLLPQVEEQTRTVTARIVLPNTDGFLRPGMFVDVRLAARLAESAVLVPELAVLRSGEHNTVFLAREGGTFEPREIQLGARSEGGFYEVLAGLDEGDRIVTSGQFMLDSESQLREAIHKMQQATAAKTTPAPLSGTGGAAPAILTADQQVLQPLALGFADAAALLAADDLAGYRKHLPALRSAVATYLTAAVSAAGGPLAKVAGSLSDPEDLKAAHRDFAPVSTAVADLARATGLHRAAGLHLYECTMAPVIGTGRWLQRAAGVRNPFYGSAMLECGEELDPPAAPAPRR